jgi:5'-3' exonuclease, N-terminal resolvase-like domain/T4 RNase H, C terminal
MIVLDYSGIAIASILGYDSKLEGSLDENKNLVRHVILSKIRDYKRRFSKEYGNEIVIACDGGDYWRKKVFPHYKASRKKNRENSDIPWDMVYQCMDDSLDVLRNFFPYKVIKVSGAEADDVMFVMSDVVCKQRGTVVGIESEVVGEKCLVISSDKDMIQLHSNTTRLYSPYKETYATFQPGETAKSFLRKLILTGDTGDGIPNVFSPASTLVDGIRQKAATEKKMKPILESSDLISGTDDPDVKKRIVENARLISFKFVPTEIVNSIIDSYNEPIEGTRMAAYEWMAANNMKLLMNDIEAF